jgi:hypothetical protein
MEEIVAKNEVFATKIKMEHPYINRWHVPQENMKLRRFH